MKHYILFWTFSGNYADNPVEVWAKDEVTAIMHTFGALFNEKVRYLVFEVGKGLVFNGKLGGENNLKMAKFNEPRSDDHGREYEFIA